MCRPETRHGDSDDILSRNSQFVESHDRHQKRQRAVEAAGYSQNSLFAVYMLQACDKSGRLDLKDFLRTLGYLGRITFRKERMRLDVAVELLVKICRSGGTKVEAGI